MSKIISKAERIAALRVIPENMVPNTLKYNIVLPNINKIRLFYAIVDSVQGTLQ